MEGDALKQQESIQLSGNILDVTGLDSHGAIIVSVDNVREPGSTETWKSSPSTPQILLESFQATTKEGSLKWNPTTDDVFVTAINAAGTSPIPTDADDKQKKTLDGALYSMSVLRKRQHED